MDKNVTLCVHIQIVIKFCKPDYESSGCLLESEGRMVLFQLVSDQAVLVQGTVSFNSHLEQYTWNSLIKKSYW